MSRKIYLTIAGLLCLGVLALSACGLLGGQAETAAPTTAAPVVESPVPPIQETPTGPPLSFLDAAGAREAAIAYLRARYMDQAPPAGVAWTEEDTTPQNLVGSASLRYTSGDWVIDVQYPVVAPENLVYNLDVKNQVAGFLWTGTVKATDGVVSELSAVIPAQVTPTPTATPTPTPQTCSDEMDFVRDVTIPDGTQLQPDEPFVKTWRLRNTGTCTWTVDYKLAFSGGEAMGASQEIPLPFPVTPGSEANLSVNLIAPTTPGEYRSEWKLRNPSGALFGLGDAGDRPFFVEIEVVQGEGELQLGAPDWRDPLDDSRFWFLVNEEDTEFEIDDGMLKMTSRRAGSLDQWGLATRPALTDFYLEATFITGEECSGLDRYGVLVRAPDSNSGYVYGFSCDGRYRIYKWDGENYQALQEWTSSGFILAGPEQTNRLGIWLEGSTIRLYANGRLLAELEDREFDEGRFGLFIGSAETDNLEIFVDEVAYWLLD